MISPESKPQNYDRVFVLEQIEGKKPINSSGIIDPNLFKDGEDKNGLYAVMDPETCLWVFKYKKGMLPPALKGQYTGLRAMTKYVENYFANRNIKVADIKYKV